MTETEIESIEDALVNIHETVLNPEIAGPLIRKNLQVGVSSKYTFIFSKDKSGIISMQSRMTPQYSAKLLGIQTHLQ